MNSSLLLWFTAQNYIKEDVDLYALKYGNEMLWLAMDTSFDVDNVMVHRKEHHLDWHGVKMPNGWANN